MSLRTSTDSLEVDVGQSLLPASSPTFTGLTLSGLTQGSVLFAGASGVVSQDNANFFYDGTNHRLALGAAVADTTLHLGVGATYRFFNLRTDASNGEWLEQKWVGNVAYIGTNKNGTGVTRSLLLEEGGTVILGHPNAGADTTSWASGSGALALQNVNSLFNTACGVNALSNNTTGQQNTSFGANALLNNTTGQKNTASGVDALSSNTTGQFNTACGVNALSNNTTGQFNTSFGANALLNNTTGLFNTASGVDALSSNTTGQQNTASGVDALYDTGAAQTAGAFVTGISYTILTTGTTDFTLIGAANSNPGTVFTATGAGSGTGTAAPNTDNNTAVGYNTGRGITYGSNNTILGAQVTGLAAGLSRAIILATGDGTILADYNNTTTSAWTLGAATTINGVLKTGTTVVSPTNITQATPSDPTGTTSTVGVMMGLAGAITPKAVYGSGNVLVHISGTVFNPTAIGDGANVQLRYGTGTAPANAAALTGTTAGGLVKYVAATTAEKAPFALNAVLTGLTLGTAYWLDVGLAAVTGGTATITDVSISAVEV